MCANASDASCVRVFVMFGVAQPCDGVEYTRMNAREIFVRMNV